MAAVAVIAQESATSAIQLAEPSVQLAEPLRQLVEPTIQLAEPVMQPAEGGAEPVVAKVDRGVFKVYKTAVQSAHTGKRYSRLICFVNVKEFAKTLPLLRAPLYNSHTVNHWEDLIW